MLAFNFQADVELNLWNHGMQQRKQQQRLHKTPTGEWQRPSPEQSLDERGRGVGCATAVRANAESIGPADASDDPVKRPHSQQTGQVESPRIELRAENYLLAPSAGSLGMGVPVHPVVTGTPPWARTVAAPKIGGKSAAGVNAIRCPAGAGRHGGATVNARPNSGVLSASLRELT